MGCASSSEIAPDDASDRPDAGGSSPSSSAARTARWVTASESHTRGALDVERLGEHVYEGERSAMRASFRAALERYPDASDASAVLQFDGLFRSVQNFRHHLFRQLDDRTSKFRQLPLHHSSRPGRGHQGFPWIQPDPFTFPQPLR